MPQFPHLRCGTTLPWSLQGEPVLALQLHCSPLPPAQLSSSAVGLSSHGLSHPWTLNALSLPPLKSFLLSKYNSRGFCFQLLVLGLSVKDRLKSPLVPGILSP